MDEEGEERGAKQFPNSPPVTVYFTNVYGTQVPVAASVVLAFGRFYVMLCYVMLCHRQQRLRHDPNIPSMTRSGDTTVADNQKVCRPLRPRTGLEENVHDAVSAQGTGAPPDPRENEIYTMRP